MIVLFLILLYAKICLLKMHQTKVQASLQKNYGGGTLKITLIIVHIIVSVIVIASVLLQPAKVQGLSAAISGGAETFFGRNKARTYEGKLEKLTTISMIIFVITSILLVYYLNK